MSQHDNRKTQLVAMYGILRCPRHWEVAIVRNGKRHRKAFFFSTLGVEGALAAAQAWRDQIVAAHRPMTRREKAQVPRVDTKEEIPGIFCRLGRDGRPELWIAHTKCSPGKAVQKSFSVGRYGDRAKDMAIAERARQLTRMKGFVLGRLGPDGCEWLERHSFPEPTLSAAEWISEPVDNAEFVNRNNKTGVAGVECRRGRNGQPQSWVARTRAGGAMLRKVFLISKYGDEQAKALAIAERRQQLQRARERLGLARNASMQGEPTPPGGPTRP